MALQLPLSITQQIRPRATRGREDENTGRPPGDPIPLLLLCAPLSTAGTASKGLGDVGLPKKPHPHAREKEKS